MNIMLSLRHYSKNTRNNSVTVDFLRLSHKPKNNMFLCRSENVANDIICQNVLTKIILYLEYLSIFYIHLPEIFVYKQIDYPINA